MSNTDSLDNKTCKYRYIYIQPAPSMTSLVCSDPSKMVCSDPPRMVCSDPYKVGGSLQTILEGSLQTKDVIDGAGCMYVPAVITYLLTYLVICTMTQFL